MSDFWSSKRVVRAKKAHQCAFCARTIPTGTSYHRETGTYGSEWNNYALCDRCRYILDHWRGYDYDDIGELWNWIEYNERTLRACGKCGEYMNTDDSDDDSLSCVCDSCGHEQNVDISLPAIIHGYETGDLR